MIRRCARSGCGCGGRSEVRGGIGHPGRVGGDSLRSEVAVFPGCLQIAKRGKRGLAAQRLRLGLGGEPADREPGPRIGFDLRPIARERLDEIVVTAECLLCLGEFLQVPPVSLVRAQGATEFDAVAQPFHSPTQAMSAFVIERGKQF